MHDPIRRCLLLALPVAWVLVGPLPSRAGDIEKIPGIPKVESLAELHAQEPLTRIDDWEVRLGLATPGEAVGQGWGLIYCDLRHVRGESGGKPKCPEIPGHSFLGSHRLGPFECIVRPKGREIPLSQVLSEGIMERCALLPNAYGPKGGFSRLLYVAALPRRLSSDGKTIPGPSVVDVYRKHKRIAMGLIPAGNSEAKKSQPDCYWYALLYDENREALRRGEAMIQKELKEDTPQTMTMLRRGALAVYPTSLIWAALDGDVERRMGSKALPGRLPPKGPWLDYRVQWPNDKRPVTLSGSDRPKQMPLRLLQNGNLLTLETPKGVHFNQKPADQLLVRWWRSGKPIPWKLPRQEPKADNRLSDTLAIQTLQTLSGTLRIELAIPPWLQAKPGDKVSLQLLWAPGYLDANQPGKWIRGIPTVDDQIRTGPLLSDVLTFRVTKQMLERGKELLAEQSEMASKSSEEQVPPQHR